MFGLSEIFAHKARYLQGLRDSMASAHPPELIDDVAMAYGPIARVLGFTHIPIRMQVMRMLVRNFIPIDQREEFANQIGRDAHYARRGIPLADAEMSEDMKERRHKLMAHMDRKRAVQ